MGDMTARNSDVERLRQAFMMEDSSKATRRFLSITTTMPHCNRSASFGVKVVPVPVPSNLENEIPVNFRLRTRSIAILQKANGILFRGIVKK